jgi:hypothetical protein
MYRCHRATRGAAIDKSRRLVDRAGTIAPSLIRWGRTVPVATDERYAFERVGVTSRSLDLDFSWLEGMTRNHVLAMAPLVLALVIGAAAYGRMGVDWRTASRAPVGLAPDPLQTPDAIVQVYAARTVGLRGLFGVHSWIAVKPAGGTGYTVYEVLGWKLRGGDTAVASSERAPDARWYGNDPELLADVRGASAEDLIPRITRAVSSYPYGGEYRAWPGPNSNTFTAWVTRAVPELEVDLPPTAIGKDFLRGRVFAAAPSGTGYQVSLRGLLAITVSRVEGLEFNILGLNFGIDPWPPAINLPLAGRLGAPLVESNGR